MVYLLAIDKTTVNPVLLTYENPPLTQTDKIYLTQYKGLSLKNTYYYAHYDSGINFILAGIGFEYFIDSSKIIPNNTGILISLNKDDLCYG